MSLIKFSDGNILSASQLNNNYSFTLRNVGLNYINMLKDRSLDAPADGGVFGEAYVDSTGQMDTVSESGSTFDINKYKAVTSATEPFIIIEASSLTKTSFEQNGCQVLQVSSNSWQISCNTGTDEEKRARIYSTVFGGGASSPIVTGATSVTSIKTSISRDVGKRAIYATVSTTGMSLGGLSGYWTGTFSNTSTNTDCSSWSLCEGYYNDADSDERLTDTTADELDNPTTCQLRAVPNSNNTGRTYWEMPSGTVLNSASTSTSGGGGTGYVANALILCAGSISWAASGSFVTSPTEYDSFVDGGIPLLSLVTEDYQNIIVHDIPTGTFSSTMSSSFLTFDSEDWESGADVQYKLTNTGGDDSGWLDSNEVQSFTAFTAEPDTLQVKLIPKTTSPTAGYPSLRGVYLASERV